MTSQHKPTDQNGFKKPVALGSKARSFIPMTPRSLKTNNDHNEFAKQVAEQSLRTQDGEPPRKKFRSSAAPKGTRLAGGYVDRARERQNEDGEGGGEVEDKQKRLKALEEMMKLQQIDQATFEALRDEIGIGGDTSSTHLVKGLDFKLLERIRRGDILDKQPEVEVPQDPDVDDRLEEALEMDIVAGEPSQEPQDLEPSTIDTPNQDVPLSRNALLQRLKQNRKNPSYTEPDTIPTKAEPHLDHSRFRKLETKPKSAKHKFTEVINGRKREVLIITAKDGTTKRKTRWLDPEPEPTKTGVNEQAWGGDLPVEVLARQKAAEEASARQKALEEEDEGDIFGGLTEYDPLADINSDDEDKPDIPTKQEVKAPDESDNTETTMNPPTTKPRNYFSTTSLDPDENPTQPQPPSHDPSIIAALKRAAQLRREETTTDPSTNTTTTTDPPTETQARNTALLAKLQRQSGYDDVDIDMGFGGDRYDEEEDTKQKLSQWKGVGVEEEDEEGEAGKKGDGKRKRGGGGGKKRKGDKNSFKDVMSVIEGRKKE